MSGPGVTKALTVRQPWAHLITCGQKPIENRTRTIRYRGPIALHAGKALDRHALTALTRAWPAGTIPAAPDLVTGAIIAVVELVDSHRAGSEVCDGDCERWGRPGPDGFHWRLAAPAPVDPIPCRGQLGLWQLAPDLAATIARR